MRQDTIDKLEAKAADTSLPPEERIALYEKITKLRRQVVVSKRIEEETARRKTQESEKTLIDNPTAFLLFGVFFFFVLPFLLVEMMLWVR